MLPQWTQAVKLEDGTRDPLGLDRAYDRFSEWLLPGITTITPRARYYAFYLWSMRVAVEKDNAANDKQLAEAMRRREAAYVLANLSERADTGQEVYGLIGWRKGRHAWEAGEAKGQFDTNFQPVRKVLGGFDQAYGGSLLKLGLWHRTEATNALNQPTEHGEKLALAYEKSIAETKYYKKLQGERILKRGDLEDYARAGGLNQLAPASQEAQLLMHLFFNRAPFESAGGERRRAALLLGLHIMREVDPLVATLAYDAADDLWVEKAGYFQTVCDQAGRVHPIHVPDGLAMANHAHAILQMHRYLAYALEHLLAFVQDRASRSAGVTLQSMMDDLNWPAVIDAYGAGLAQPVSDALELWMDALRHAVEQQGKNRDVLLPLEHPASEYNTSFDLYESSNEVKVGLALRLIFAICLRAQHMKKTVPMLWLESKQVAGDGLWTEDLVAHLQRGCERGLTIKQYLSEFLQRYVVQQHDRVRLIKGAFAMGWLGHDADGALRKLQDFTPRYRGTRLRSASSILADLGLLESDGVHRRISKRGKRLLEQMLDEGSGNGRPH